MGDRLDGGQVGWGTVWMGDSLDGGQVGCSAYLMQDTGDRVVAGHNCIITKQYKVLPYQFLSFFFLIFRSSEEVGEKMNKEQHDNRQLYGCQQEEF